MNKISKVKLWHTLDARSLRCLWTLEELKLEGRNIDYELITMPFPPRVFHKEYLQKNSLGTIPLLEDGNIRMTESNAISQYLCDKYGPTKLVVKPNEPLYGTYLNWLHHGEATLTFPQTIVLRYTKQEKGRADNAANDYGRWFLARLRMLNKTLEDGREYLLDISVAYALFLGTTLSTDGVPLSERYKQPTRDYLDRMIKREGWVNAQKVQLRSSEEFKKLNGKQSRI